MEDDLLETAKASIEDWLTDNVRKVEMTVSVDYSRIDLRYYFVSTPSSDDVEQAQLALTYLLADYPEIQRGSVRTDPSAEDATEGRYVKRAVIFERS